MSGRLQLLDPQPNDIDESILDYAAQFLDPNSLLNLMRVSKECNAAVIRECRFRGITHLSSPQGQPTTTTSTQAVQAPQTVQNAPPILLGDLVRQLQKISDVQQRVHIGEAHCRRLGALAQHCKTKVPDDLEKFIKSLCLADSESETFKGLLSHANNLNIATKAAQSYVTDAYSWSRDTLQLYLQVNHYKDITIQGQNFPCISNKCLPKTIRLLLLTIMQQKSNSLVFCLDAQNGLAHTPHWDTENLLPWCSTNERSPMATEVSKSLFELDEVENNAKKVIDGNPNTRIKNLRKAKLFPATIEYAMLALGPSARVVISYDADSAGPVPFISAHYGSALPEEQRTGMAHFVIDDIETSPPNGALTNTIQLTPGAMRTMCAPETVMEMFPKLWALGQKPPKGAVEMNNSQFFQALMKAADQQSTTFQDIFTDKTISKNRVSSPGGGMRIIEFVKHRAMDPSLSNDMFDVHLSVRADNMDIHVALRPWADHRSGYASSNVGLPTSYFFYRLFLGSDGKFLLCAKGGQGDPFGQSKMNLLICSEWLKTQHKDVRSILDEVITYLADCVNALNVMIKDVNMRSFGKKHSPYKDEKDQNKDK